MCGLVMLINKNKNGFNATQNNVFTSLLYLSGHYRGRDGVGVVSIDNIGNVKLAKEAFTVDEFIRTKEYHDLDRDAFQKGWAMIGHNRAATRGVVSDENSHPFVADDNIILVHNGTFQGDHKKLKETEVDSEAIAHVLADKDLTTEQALRKINAAYALMWYNVEKKEINIIRNSQRPLWYMETNDSYIYASEEHFLEFVKRKHNLTVKLNPFEIKELNLSRYWLDDKNNMEFESVEIDCSYWKHQPTHGGVTQGHGPFQGSIAGGVRRHPLACGWPVDDDLDGFDQALAMRIEAVNDKPAASSTTSIVTKWPALVQKVITALGTTAETMSLDAHDNILKRYNGTNKLRCLATDLVEADDNPRTDKFVLIGRTLDENRLHVVFPLKGKSLEQVMELSSDAVFEIDYSGITWSRKADDKDGKDMKDWNGVALLHGVNPTPIYTAGGNSVAC